jgi:PAS domain S-box-containing protein
MVFQPLIESDGTAVATMSLLVPLDQLHAAANRKLWTEMAFLLAGLVLSFVLAQQGVRRAVMQPLRRLLEATDQLAKGRYAPLAPTSGVAELTELGSRFDHMAQTRQSTEAQLRESEENLSITLHSIGDGVIATDAQGSVTRMNAVAERLTGWLLAEAKGRNLTEVFRIVNASTRQPVVDPAKMVIEKGEVVGLSNHTTLIARGGAEYQIADSAAPIRNAQGRIVGVVLVFSDVTEAYRVRKQLEENEARFRTLTRLSSDWYWEQDEQFRLTQVEGSSNDRLVQEASAYLGKTRWETAVPGLSDERWQEHRELLQRHEEFRDLEYQRTDIHGRVYWVSISGSPKFDSDGTFRGYRGVGKDITARKRDENELRIAAIAFESQEGMMVTDSDTVILRTNRAFTKITGYSAQDAVGQRCSLLASGHHDKAFFAAMWTSLAEKREWKGELWNRCKDGEVSLHFISITAVTDAAGHVTHYVGTLSDITQRARAAREIEHLAFYDPLTQLPNRRLVPATGVCRQCPLWLAGRVALPGPRPFQDPERHARPRYGGPASAKSRAASCELCARRGHRGAPRRRRVPGAAAGSGRSADHRGRAGAGRVREDTRGTEPAVRPRSEASAQHHERGCRALQWPRADRGGRGQARRPCHVCGKGGRAQRDPLLRPRHAGRSHGPGADGKRSARSAGC